VSKRRERDLADQVFSTRDFIRTLSHREFVTSLSLALFLLSLCLIVDYYDNEDWVEANETTIKWTLFFLAMPSNHIFYKQEHRRSNNFIGRNIHDYIFLIFFAFVINSKNYLYGLGFTMHFKGGLGGAIAWLFIIVLFIMTFETVIAFIKRGLNFLGWRVL